MIPADPSLWGAELSRVAAGLVVHFLWMGSLGWFLAAVLRRLLARSGPECRYLFSVIALAALAGTAVAAGVLAMLAFPAVLVIAPTDIPERLPVIWFAGMLLLLMNRLRGIIAVRRLRSGWTPAPANLQLRCSSLLAMLRIVQPVAVAICERIHSPIVAGVLRPIILLPRTCVHWTADRLEIVLLHELVHVRRQDNLIILFQRCAEAVLWFHPAVWSISRWIDEEREFCCDDLVLSATRQPEAYAETLIALCESPPQLALCSALRRNTVHVRLRRILFPEELAMSRPLRWEALPVAVCCLAGGMLAVGSSARETAAARPAAVAAAAPVEPVVASPLLQPAAALSQLIVQEPYRGKTDGQQGIFLIDDSGRTVILDVSGQVISGPGAKRSWGPEQATGVPDTLVAGDQSTAWASRSPDDSEEWLICEYETAVMLASVSVHETYNPGALYKVTAFNESGEEVVAWEGADPTPRAEPEGISVIPVKLDFATKRIKLYIDSPAVPGWNEIDAVGIESEDGDKQWAINIECSTTYAEPEVAAVPVSTNRSWGPEQVVGEPDSLVAGDQTTAWASLTQDGQEEWLICRYESPQQPSEVVVHENYNPGAVHKITALAEDGSETLLWEGEDPTPRDQPRGVSVIPVAPESPVQAIKVYIDSAGVPGWNEIDAVGLRDADGETAWAAGVEASSTYAVQSVKTTFEPPSVVYISSEEILQLQQDVAMLKEQLAELQQLRDEIKELKELLQQDRE
jgi:beta-lactamase regulating signal transducer with metallopeptidase domain